MPTNDYNVPGDYSTIQAAINALGSTGGAVYIEPATYTITQPILIQNPNIRMEGRTGRNGGVLIETSGFWGPALHLGIANTVPTVTQLATGTGGAFALPLIGQGMLDLRLSSLATVDNLSTFTIEFFCQGGNGAVGNYLIASSGSRYSNVQNVAFFIGQDGNSDFYAGLTINGTFYSNSLRTSVNGNVANTVYHLALTYDGTTARFFIGGVLKASFTASGTITQYAHETVVLGPGNPNLFYTFSTNPPQGAVVDSVRISKSCRYTAGFTPPTAKFSSDANTQLLLNFDNATALDAGFVYGYTGAASTPVWIPYAGNLLQTGEIDLAYFHIQNIFGPAITQFSVRNSRFHDLSFWSIIGWFGCHDCFECSYRDIFCQAYTGQTNAGGSPLFLWGFVLAGPSGGPNSYRDMIVDGHVYGFVLTNTSGVFDNLSYTPEGYTKIAFYAAAYGGGNNLMDCRVWTIDDEPSSLAPMDYACYFREEDSVKCSSFGLQAQGSGPCPMIGIDGGGCYTFDTCDFLVIQTTPEIFNVVAAPTSACRLNCSYHTPSGTITWVNGGTVTDLLASGSTLTAAECATAVWQDLLSSSDFTTSGSVGALLAALKLDGNSYIKANAETVSDKTGFSLVSSGLDGIAIESGLNARQALSIAVAVLAGLVTGATTGASTITITGAGVATNRVTAATDTYGNRTAVTLSPPS